MSRILVVFVVALLISAGCENGGNPLSPSGVTPPDVSTITQMSASPKSGEVLSYGFHMVTSLRYTISASAAAEGAAIVSCLSNDGENYFPHRCHGGDQPLAGQSGQTTTRPYLASNHSQITQTNWVIHMVVPGYQRLSGGTGLTPSLKVPVPWLVNWKE